MKKNILTLLLAFCTAMGFSQVLFESFENTSGPDPIPSTNWTLGSGNWAVFDNNVGGTVNWSINPNWSIPFGYAGTKCAYIDSEYVGPGITTEEYLATPLFTVPENGEISFYSRSFFQGNQGTIYQVKIALGGNQSNPSAYTTLLAEFNEDQLSSNYLIYEEKTIDLSVFAGNQVYIAFVRRHTQPTVIIPGDKWLLDNVMIQSHPTCLKPIDLVSTNSTPTSVTLDWTDTSGSIEWEIIAIPTGSAVITPSSASSIVTNTHPFTVTNLNPYTSYSFYVRSVCSSSEKSNWSTVLSTITPEACIKPSNILVSAVGLTSATFNWTENGSASSWEVVVLPYGTLVTPSTTGIVTTSNPYTLNNLVPDTKYKVYIRSLCSVSDASLWESTYEFSTAIPPPIPCGGYFVDNGGSSNNYLNNSNYTYTICPTNANDVVTVTFSEFNTEVNFDGLYVYDGDNISQPAILSENGSGSGLLTDPGAFWGNLNNNLPGPFTATGPSGCLTFRFVGDGSVVNSGWKASVSCGSRDHINLVAFIDSNSNGIKDVNERHFKYGSFVYDENNAGSPTSVYAPNGNYLIYDTAGGTSYNFSYEIQSEYQPYYNLGSVSNYSNITIPTGSGSQTLYFPIQLTQSYSDLSIFAYNGYALAGLTDSLTIYCKNNGLTSTDGTITFVKPTQISYYTTNPPNVTPTANGFTYSFTNLQPNETLYLQVQMSIPPIPTVAIGELLVSTISVVSSTNDVNLLNNSHTNTQIVQASYDPNDKTESHGGTIEFADFTEDDYLYYTVRFENTGTASATTVRIEDELDNQLDESTVRVVSSSHDYNMVRQSKHLTFNFNNINLPVSDHPNSTIGQGFVMFKVKPKSGYAIGDIIPNTAEIYFDSNPAIVTNTFNTEFVQTLATTSFESNNVLLYPNPSHSSIQVSLQNTTETIDRVSITDVSGKNIRNLKSTSVSQLTIDVSELSKGMYFVEIITQNGLKLTKKLIKK